MKKITKLLLGLSILLSGCQGPGSENKPISTVALTTLEPWLTNLSVSDVSMVRRSDGCGCVAPWNLTEYHYIEDKVYIEAVLAVLANQTVKTYQGPGMVAPGTTTDRLDFYVGDNIYTLTSLDGYGNNGTTYYKYETSPFIRTTNILKTTYTFVAAIVDYEIFDSNGELHDVLFPFSELEFKETSPFILDVEPYFIIMIADIKLYVHSETLFTLSGPYANTYEIVSDLTFRPLFERNLSVQELFGLPRLNAEEVTVLWEYKDLRLSTHPTRHKVLDPKKADLLSELYELEYEPVDVGLLIDLGPIEENLIVYVHNTKKTYRISLTLTSYLYRYYSLKDSRVFAEKVRSFLELPKGLFLTLTYAYALNLLTKEELHGIASSYNNEPLAGKPVLSAEVDLLLRQEIRLGLISQLNFGAALDDISVTFYGGEFCGNHVVKYEDTYTEYTQMLWSEVIDDVTINYANGNRIYLYTALADIPALGPVLT